MENEKLMAKNDNMHINIIYANIFRDPPYCYDLPKHQVQIKFRKMTFNLMEKFLEDIKDFDLFKDDISEIISKYESEADKAEMDPSNEIVDLYSVTL